MTTTAVVTVLYNSRDVLIDFFQSLDRQTNRDFTLYVVDNASPDDSLEQARELAKIVSFSTVFIENPQNTGIAHGNNLGIRTAQKDGCRWILLSNNDTVWQPDTLARLREQAERAGWEIIAPKIRYAGSERIWYAGGHWNRWRGGTTHIKNERIRTARPVEYASSCCMLIHNTVFERIGGMDERFFLYYDDSDFVRRATGAGIPVGYVPQAVIAHKEGASTGAVSPTAQYWLSRNLLLFTQKHESKLDWFRVLVIHLAILCTKRLFTFAPATWQAAWRGTCDGIRLCREKQAETILEQAWEG